MSLTVWLVIGSVLLLSGIPVICCMLSSAIRQADEAAYLELEAFAGDPLEPAISPTPRLA